LALAAPLARGDQLHMADGTLLEGDVVRADEDRIELRTRDGTVVRVDRSDVLVHLDDEKRVVPREGSARAAAGASAGASTGAEPGAGAMPSTGAGTGPSAPEAPAGGPSPRGPSPGAPTYAPISAPDARVRAEQALVTGKADALAVMSPADAVAALSDAIAAAAERIAVSPTARAEVRHGARIAIAYEAHATVLALLSHPRAPARAAAISAIADASLEAAREAVEQARILEVQGEPADAPALVEDALRPLRDAYADALARALEQDPDEGARAAALEALAPLDPLRVLPALTSNDPRQRRRAVDLLVALPEGAIADEEAAVRLLSTGRTGVTTAVLEVLTRHTIPTLQERVQRLLAPEEPLEVRLAALRALAALGASQVPTLGGLLSDAAPEVRVLAAERLATLGDPAAIPWLVAALDGAEGPFARTITGGLLRITGERRQGASYSRWAAWAKERGIVLPERRPRRGRVEAEEAAE